MKTRKSTTCVVMMELLTTSLDVEELVLVSKGLMERVLRPLVLMTMRCGGWQEGLIVERVDNRVWGELCRCSYASQGGVIVLFFPLLEGKGEQKTKADEGEDPYFCCRDEND